MLFVLIIAVAVSDVLYGVYLLQFIRVDVVSLTVKSPSLHEQQVDVGAMPVCANGSRPLPTVCGSAVLHVDAELTVCNPSHISLHIGESSVCGRSRVKPNNDLLCAAVRAHDGGVISIDADTCSKVLVPLADRLTIGLEVCDEDAVLRIARESLGFAPLEDIASAYEQFRRSADPDKVVWLRDGLARNESLVRDVEVFSFCTINVDVGYRGMFHVPFSSASECDWSQRPRRQSPSAQFLRGNLSLVYNTKQVRIASHDNEFSAAVDFGVRIENSRTVEEIDEASSEGLPIDETKRTRPAFHVSLDTTRLSLFAQPLAVDDVVLRLDDTARSHSPAWPQDSLQRCLWVDVGAEFHDTFSDGTVTVRGGMSLDDKQCMSAMIGHFGHGNATYGYSMLPDNTTAARSQYDCSIIRRMISNFIGYAAVVHQPAVDFDEVVDTLRSSNSTTSSTNSTSSSNSTNSTNSGDTDKFNNPFRVASVEFTDSSFAGFTTDLHLDHGGKLPDLVGVFPPISVGIAVISEWNATLYSPFINSRAPVCSVSTPAVPLRSGYERYRLPVSLATEYAEVADEYVYSPFLGGVVGSQARPVPSIRDNHDYNLTLRFTSLEVPGHLISATLAESGVFFDWTRAQSDLGSGLLAGGVLDSMFGDLTPDSSHTTSSQLLLSKRLTIPLLGLVGVGIPNLEWPALVFRLWSDFGAGGFSYDATAQTQWSDVFPVSNELLSELIIHNADPAHLPLALGDLLMGRAHRIPTRLFMSEFSTQFDWLMPADRLVDASRSQQLLQVDCAASYIYHNASANAVQLSLRMYNAFDFALGVRIRAFNATVRVANTTVPVESSVPLPDSSPTFGLPANAASTHTFEAVVAANTSAPIAATVTAATATISRATVDLVVNNVYVLRRVALLA